MSESLGDLLTKRLPSEPPEVKAIKEFAKERLNVIPSVTIGQSQITISMPDAASAGSLRMQIFELQQILQTDKKLVIRIG